MKKPLLFIIILPLLLFACKKADELTQFSMSYTETVVIESSVGTALPFSTATPPIQSESESKFENNDTRKDLIEQIVLTNLELTVTSPSGGDFGFLKDVYVYINADGLDEKPIAQEENIPSDVGAFLDLETSEDNLEQYIKKEEFSIKVEVVTDETITNDHHIEVFSEFFVDAKILGV